METGGRPSQPAATIEAGQEALRRGSWEEARACFEAVLAREEGDRLVVLKSRYDPTNLFRLNQNIRPKA